MAAVTIKEKNELMKIRLSFFVIILFLLLRITSVAAQKSSSFSNNLTLRCTAFPNVFPQNFIRSPDSFGKGDNSIICKFYNPWVENKKEPSGSESDVDIIPDYVHISGSKIAKDLYEQQKNTDTTDEFNRYKIIAQDVVGEKSYFGVQGVAFVNPAEGQNVVIGRLAFFKGPCFVTLQYYSKMNANVTQYHPYKDRPPGFENLHPSFDHGAKRIREEMEIIAGNITNVCGSNKILANNEGSISRDTDKQPVNESSKNSKPQSSFKKDPSRYSQALVIESPKENYFQKVPQSDFKIVYPIGTASANLVATNSAGITGSIFIGKVGNQGQIVIKLPNGESIVLKDDKTAYKDSMPNWWYFRNFGTAPAPVDYFLKPNISYKEVDCHILLEQEKKDEEELQRFGEIRRANNYNLYDRTYIIPTGDCDFQITGGTARVLVEKGELSLTTQSGTTLTASNADFGIGYDTESGFSTIEIYNGSVNIANKVGQSKKISTVYGSQINRIEVDKNGAMTEKIALSQSEWEAFLASQEKDSSFVLVIIVLAMGGFILFLYRKGKLKSLYITLIQKTKTLFLRHP